MLGGKKKEMLFTLGQFLRETDRKFAEAPLLVTVSKAEFIDVILGMSAVSKKERAVYRNLEELGKEHYIAYNDKCLRFSKKGLQEYERIQKELEQLKAIESKIEAQKLIFKRRLQTKLK
jgi:hypothetical protein